METEMRCPVCGAKHEVYNIGYNPPMYGTRCQNGCDIEILTLHEKGMSIANISENVLVHEQTVRDILELNKREIKLSNPKSRTCRINTDSPDVVTYLNSTKGKSELKIVKERRSKFIMEGKKEKEDE